MQASAVDYPLTYFYNSGTEVSDMDGRRSDHRQNWVGSTWRRRQNLVSETLQVLNIKHDDG
jgi:hypothetical protein